MLGTGRSLIERRSATQRVTQARLVLTETERQYVGTPIRRDGYRLGVAPNLSEGYEAEDIYLSWHILAQLAVGRDFLKGCGGVA